MRFVGITPGFLFTLLAVLTVTPWAAASEKIGTGNASLLGGDLTDPKDAIKEKDGVNYGRGAPEEELRPLNTGWVSLKMAPVSPPGSPPHQIHAYQSWQGAPGCAIFLNNPEKRKWYIGFKDGGKSGPTKKEPYYLAVEFKDSFILTHFTLTTSPDMPDRDPKEWAIQGSNTGQNDDWTDIYKCEASDRKASPLQVNPRNETTLFTSFTSGTMKKTVGPDDLKKLESRLKEKKLKLEKADFNAPKPYKWFRIVIYSCFNPNSNTYADFNRPPGFALGQLELFGTPAPKAPREVAPNLGK